MTREVEMFIELIFCVLHLTKQISIAIVLVPQNTLFLQILWTEIQVLLDIVLYKTDYLRDHLTLVKPHSIVR